MGGLSAVHQFSQDRRACLYRQQRRRDARCAAVCHGGRPAGRAAFGQRRGHAAPRLHRRADSQCPQRLSYLVPLGPQARRGAWSGCRSSRQRSPKCRVFVDFIGDLDAQSRQMSGGGGRDAAALRIGLVAGEASGDQLGAALIDALRARVPQLECFGVAGPKMIAAGCEPWGAPSSSAVMGLAEVLRHLPRLLRLRRSARQRALLRGAPDVFVGIDAPEFNLALAARLKAARHAHRAVREPAGVGLAAGRAQRTIGRACRSGVVPAALREALLCGARGACRLRRPSAGGSDSARVRSRRGARRRCGFDHGGDRWSRCCLAAGAARSERLAADFAAAAALDGARASCACNSSRRWQAPPYARSCSARAPQAAPALIGASWTGRRSACLPPATWRWSPPAPPPSRPCSRSGRWWSPTVSAPLTAFVARRLSW